MASARLCVVSFVILAGCRFTVDPNPGSAPDMSATDGSIGGCDSCPSVCDPSPQPHCKHLVPSGPVVPDDFTQAGLQPQMVSGDIIIDTDTGAINGAMTRPAASGVVGGVGFRSAQQSGGPAVGVFSVAGLEL